MYTKFDNPTLVVYHSDCFFLFWLIKMKHLVFILVFAVSAGLSVMGLISSYRLKEMKLPFSSSLFYYKVFLVAFGFYGIWSHLIFTYLYEGSILEGIEDAGLLGFFPILGIPLLIVAWYLFLQFSVEIGERKFPGWYSIVYFLILIVGFFLLGIYYSHQVNTNRLFDWMFIQQILVIINFIFILSGSLVILNKRKKITQNYSSSLIIGSELIPFALFSISLFMVSSHWLFVVSSIIFYFSAITILPTLLYFKSAKFVSFSRDFEGFCEKFEISKREAEIIQEICKGKTNKEIGDSLYITLQTVKDHTHRIYSKTNVSNRVQLTNLVNEFLNSASNS